MGRAISGSGRSPQVQEGEDPQEGPPEASLEAPVQEGPAPQTEAQKRAQGAEAEVSVERGPVMSKRVRRYFQGLLEDVEHAYRIAREARGKGKDPVLEVEILPAEDLAARVEAQVQVPGVAEDIRKVTKEIGNRELVSLEIARRVAAGKYGEFRSRELAVDKAVRTGLSILTEGVLVAPLEGIAEVKISQNSDGSEYVDLFFAGPIRAAGGTAQALSVLIADVVRREAGIGEYQVTPEEVERYKEEVPAYRQAANLQYTPDAKEIDLIVRNCPVCLNGEGTDKVEVTGNRDLPRVPTNQLRGGAMLVLCEGMCLKAPKILKHVNKLGLEGWDFLERLLKKKEEEQEQDEGGGQEDEEEDGEKIPVIEPSTKYVRDLIAGRPVFSHPSRPGGFRLRYGRGRTAGLASVAMHPAVMPLMDDFLAIGTQLKTERPGKGTIATPCDLLDPPKVLLKNGDLITLRNGKEVQAAKPFLQEILDLGEILVPFGEFAENNHLLVQSPWVQEWFEKKVAKRAQEGWPEGVPDPDEVVDQEAQGTLDPVLAHEVAKATDVPLSPTHTLSWHDLEPEELVAFSSALAGVLEQVRFAPPSKREVSERVPEDPLPAQVLVLPNEGPTKALLERLLLPHRVVEDTLEVTRGGYPLLRGLGFDIEQDRVVETERRSVVADHVPPGLPKRFPTVDLASRLAGVPLMPRHPTRIGARMGRPEKASHRKMKPPPHSLFALGNAGGIQRLFTDAALKGKIRVENGKRSCTQCGQLTYRTFCSCGAHTSVAGEPEEVEIDLRGELRRAVTSLGVSKAPAKMKGVTGLMSENKTPEPLEKGILRAKHEITTFKDGTARFDMTDAPLTHFRPREIGTPIERLRELGYEQDVHGEPLQRDDQLLELMVQDVVLPETCGDFLVSCAHFVDDLLERFYQMDRFYKAEHRRDLVGHLVGGLAPHTSGAIAARVIGYTPSQMGWAHPYFHAGKRRNCLHPETEVHVDGPAGTHRLRIDEIYEQSLDAESRADDAGALQKEIKDLKAMSVDPESGKLVRRRVLRALKVPAPESLVKVATRSGGVMTCSPDHRVLVMEDDRLVKKRAKELRMGESFANVSVPEVGSDHGSGQTLTIPARLGDLVSDPVVDIKFVETDTDWLYDLEVEDTHNYFVDDLTLTSNCDGDEDAIFLLMDGLLNFSRHYVPDRRGGLMDLPLVLTTRLDPAEIDKEAHNLDVLSSYPLEFYEATTRHLHPREVEGAMGLVGGRLGTEGQYEGLSFTHDTPSISQGVLVSAYKTIPDMMSKLEAQFELADRIRAVDLKDVASRVIGGHFMPDLIGNLKAFSKQKVRCPLCNSKYRRMPVAGRCLTEDCKGRLTLTVHEGSVRKYLQPALEISRKYEVPAYTLQRIMLAEKSIESLFNNDKVKKAKLTDFLAAE